MTNCNSIDYQRVGRSEGSCCDVSVHCASLKCNVVDARCEGAANPDAESVTADIESSDASGAQPEGQSYKDETYYESIAKAEEKYVEEYTPVTGLLFRLISMSVVTLVLTLVAIILNCLARRKGGWDMLCLSCCKASLPKEPTQNTGK